MHSEEEEEYEEYLHFLFLRKICISNINFTVTMNELYIGDIVCKLPSST